MPHFIQRLLAALLLLQGIIVLPAAVWAEGEADPLWNRPSFEKKVIDVGQRLLAANGIQERITFYSATLDIRNASASRWGGPNTVVIYKDLLDVMESDDELAAVLGHEIAHIIKRHTGKVFPRRAVAKTALWTTYTLGGTAAILATGGLATAPVVLAGAGMKRMEQKGIGVTDPISRPFEREADLVGLAYMVKAGYNPLAMETLMAKISGDAGPVATFFSSHPGGTERLTYIHEEIVQKYPQYLTAEQAGNPLPGAPYQLQVVESPAETTTDKPATQTQTTHPAMKTESEVKPLSSDKHQEDVGDAEPVKATSVAFSKETEKPVGKQKAVQSSVLVAKEKDGPAGQVMLATTQKAPAKVSYQPKETGAKPSLKTQIASVADAKSAQSGTPIIGEKTESVAVTLLSLQPPHLRILRMISQRGYLNSRELKEQMAYIESDTLTTYLNDLVDKKLIRILGAEHEAVVVLTEWASDAFKPVLSGETH